jgi:hypothetical protein
MAADVNKISFPEEPGEFSQELNDPSTEAVNIQNFGSIIIKGSAVQPDRYPEYKHTE